MSLQNVCNYEKFGHCRNREECSDFHPKDVCTEKICQISKCRKRHPKACIFFKSGSCKYGDACKYSHKDDACKCSHEEEIKDLKEQVKKLDGMNKLLHDQILLVHDRVSNIEKEYVNFLKKYSDEKDEDIVTSAGDDQMFDNVFKRLL